MISHDVELLDAAVNKVWYLDANRSVVDIYNVGWKTYLEPRETDERRRRRERANAEKKAGALMAQADKMRAKATKTVAAQNMARRAEKLLGGLEEVRTSDKVAKVRFPNPAPVRQDPADRGRAVQVVRFAGDLHRRRRGGGPGLPGRHPRASTAPARPPCCGSSAACSSRTPARCARGTGCGWATTPRSTRRWTWTARSSTTCAAPAPSRPTPSCARSSARSCSPATTSTSRPGCSPAARRPGSRWPPWSVPAPTCCCSTSRRTTSTRSAASRCSTRSPTTRARSCWSPTTPGAVQALKPDRAILLPDGDEDAWSDDLLELVELA